MNLEVELQHLADQISSRSKGYEETIDSMHKEMEYSIDKKNKVTQQLLVGGGYPEQIDDLQQKLKIPQMNYNKQVTSDLQEKNSELESAIVAKKEAEELRVTSKKKFSETQRKYMDQIKLLDAKLKKKNEEEAEIQKKFADKKDLIQKNRIHGLETLKSQHETELNKEKDNHQIELKAKKKKLDEEFHSKEEIAQEMIEIMKSKSSNLRRRTKNKRNNLNSS